MPAVEIGVVEFLDFGLERVLPRALDPRRRIYVGRHVEIVRARAQTRFQHRVIRLAGAGIAGDRHLVLSHEGSKPFDIHSVRLHDHEAVPRRPRRKLLREDRIEIGKHDPVKAVEFVQLLSDDGTNATDSNDHCVCHK